VDTIKLRGDTPEKKMHHAEVILNRLARRAKKNVVVLMPTCPISATISDIAGIGPFYTFLSSVDGTIKRVVLEVSCSKFKEATISIVIERKGSAPGASFVVKEGVCTFETDVEIVVGDKVVFYLLNLEKGNTQEAGYTTIDLGFSIVPMRNEAEAKAIAIDSLEGSVDEIISD